MQLKYTRYALNENEDFVEWIGTNNMLYTVWFILAEMLGPIYHWTYASQYLKTCFLTKDIIKRAVLLFQRNKTTIVEHGSTQYWNEFVREHNKIDEALKNEKSRTKAIKRVFLFIDITLSLILLSIEGFPANKSINASS